MPEADESDAAGREPDPPRGSVTLRPATRNDWPLIERWLRLPAVESWFGSARAAEAEIRIVFETRSSVARIVECDGKPIGYAHAIDATHWGDSLPDGMPPGTWDLDCVIAEPSFRGRGVGRRAVDLMAAEVFGTTLALHLAVVVPVSNESAVRAYERAGFAWVRIVTDPLFGASWLMLRHRS